MTYYRDEERTGYRMVNGRLESYTYTVAVPYQVYESYQVEVEYDYYILNTTLTNYGISAAVNALNLTEDQMQRYMILLETRGNKPDMGRSGFCFKTFGGAVTKVLRRCMRAGFVQHGH